MRSSSPKRLVPIFGTPGGALEVDTYPRSSGLQRKRFLAQSRGTSFVYDLPAMFSKAVSRSWSKHNKKSPKEKVLEAQEFEVDAQGKFVATNRPPGSNKIGMVAWRLRMSTPEY